MAKWAENAFKEQEMKDDIEFLLHQLLLNDQYQDHKKIEEIRQKYMS